MTTSHVIDELEELLKNSIGEVFTTMLSMAIEPCTVAPFPPDEMLVAASVGFIGEVTGVIYIYTTDAQARNITSRMLGLPEPEIDGHEIVNDTMGELGNMIVGQIKSRLCDTGRKCVLTIPSIVRGQNFCVESVTSTTNRKVGFRAAGQPVNAEILIKAVE